MIRNFSFSAGLWENDSPQAPPWKRVVNKQFSGKGVCSLQRCLGNLTLNNTDVWFPTGGNGFIMFQRSPVCAGLLYSPVFGLDCPLALYISAIKEAGLGALVVFFFFSLSHFPAVFWTAFLQTSYSPWGIVSAWRDWMIVLIHKGLESDSEQGDATEITFTGKAVSPAKCGELFFFPLADFLAPRAVFSCGLPEMELPWQLSGVTLLRGHFLFLSFYLSTFRMLETFKPCDYGFAKKARSSGSFTVLVSLVTRWRIDSKFSSSLGNANRKKTVTSEQHRAGVNSAWKRKELCLRSSPMFWTRGRSWTPGTLDFFKQRPLEMEYI